MFTMLCILANMRTLGITPRTYPDQIEPDPGSVLASQSFMGWKIGPNAKIIPPCAPFPRQKEVQSDFTIEVKLVDKRSQRALINLEAWRHLRYSMVNLLGFLQTVILSSQVSIEVENPVKLN